MQTHSLDSGGRSTEDMKQAIVHPHFPGAPLVPCRSLAAASLPHALSGKLSRKRAFSLVHLHAVRWLPEPNLTSPLGRHAKHDPHDASRTDAISLFSRQRLCEARHKMQPSVSRERLVDVFPRYHCISFPYNMGPNTTSNRQSCPLLCLAYAPERRRPCGNYASGHGPRCCCRCRCRCCCFLVCGGAQNRPRHGFEDSFTTDITPSRLRCCSQRQGLLFSTADITKAPSRDEKSSTKFRAKAIVLSSFCATSLCPRRQPPGAAAPKAKARGQNLP